MTLYYKIFYINQVISNLLVCVLIQCVILRVGVIDFGAVEHCYALDNRVNLTEVPSQTSHIGGASPILSDRVTIQIPSPRMGEPAYETSTSPNEFIFQTTNTYRASLGFLSSMTENPIYRTSTDLNEVISQTTNTYRASLGFLSSITENPIYRTSTDLNEVLLEIPNSITEEHIYEAIPDLDEINTLIPLIDGVSLNRAEEHIYESIPDLRPFSSQRNPTNEMSLRPLASGIEEPVYETATDPWESTSQAGVQTCCMTVTQQKECSAYIGFFVGLSTVAAFTLYLLYFNGTGEMTRSCNFPDLIKQLEDIFRNL